MGYCHKCQHDCSERDPCPCCRGHNKYVPWRPTPTTTIIGDAKGVKTIIGRK
jgi:hypothetical protein